MTAPAVTELAVRVIHEPAPQGSFFAQIVGKGRGMRAIVVSDNKRTEPWRKAVGEAARNAMRAYQWLTLADACSVEIVFLLTRPKTVRRVWPCVRPDVDKLARSTLDALTAAGVFADDALVVRLAVEKRYAEGRQQPGARITVRPVDEVLL